MCARRRARVYRIPERAHLHLCKERTPGARAFDHCVHLPRTYTFFPPPRGDMYEDCYFRARLSSSRWSTRSWSFLLAERIGSTRSFSRFLAGTGVAGCRGIMRGSYDGRLMGIFARSERGLSVARCKSAYDYGDEYMRRLFGMLGIMNL